MLACLVVVVVVLLLLLLLLPDRQISGAHFCTLGAGYSMRATPVSPVPHSLLVSLPVSLPGPGLPLLQLPTSLVLPPHFHDPSQRSWDLLGIDGLVRSLSDPWPCRSLRQWLVPKACWATTQPAGSWRMPLCTRCVTNWSPWRDRWQANAALRLVSEQKGELRSSQDVSN